MALTITTLYNPINDFFFFPKRACEEYSHIRKSEGGINSILILGIFASINISSFNCKNAILYEI